MTNREKFAEVYGFELEGSPCVAPEALHLWRPKDGDWAIMGRG